MKKRSLITASATAIALTLGAIQVPSYGFDKNLFDELAGGGCWPGKLAPYVAIRIDERCEGFFDYKLEVFELDPKDGGTPRLTSTYGPARYGRGPSVIDIKGGSWTLDLEEDQPFIIAVVDGPEGFENLPEVVVRVKDGTPGMQIFSNGTWGDWVPEFFFEYGVEGHRPVPKPPYDDPKDLEPREQDPKDEAPQADQPQPPVKDHEEKKPEDAPAPAPEPAPSTTSAQPAPKPQNPKPQSPKSEVPTTSVTSTTTQPAPKPEAPKPAPTTSMTSTTTQPAPKLEAPKPAPTKSMTSTTSMTTQPAPKPDASKLAPTTSITSTATQSESKPAPLPSTMSTTSTAAESTTSTTPSAAKPTPSTPRKGQKDDSKNIGSSSGRTIFGLLFGGLFLGLLSFFGWVFH